MDEHGREPEPGEEPDLDLDEPEPVTVREAIAGELAHDVIHGYSMNHRSEDTVYVVVYRTVEAEAVETAPDAGFPVLDRRTVAVDLREHSVAVTDNGLWTPAETGVIEGDLRLGGRAISDTTNGEPVGEPLVRSEIETDGDVFLGALIETDAPTRNVERMKREPGISGSREWGYNAGPPAEVETVIDRLAERDRDPDEHLIRLKFGTKVPFDEPREPVETSELRGNYGIELRPREAGLVAVDIDNPEAIEPDTLAELPDTFAVSSPHGSDEQKHLLFWCHDKSQISGELGGAWASQSVEWGDLWVGDRYLVGPGCQLSEFGCTAGEHEAEEPGGCDRCADPDGGYYEILRDEPIATIEAETVIDHLLPDDEPAVDVSEADEEAAEEIIENHVRCDRCGDVIHREDALATEMAGDEVHICSGGCGGGGGGE